MILLFIGFQPGFSPTSAQPHFKCRETILSLLLVSYLALFHFLLPYWCCLMRCGLYRCVCLLLALLPWRKSQELVHDPLSPRSAYPSIISQQFILWLKVVGGWGFSGLCSSFPQDSSKAWDSQCLLGSQTQAAAQGSHRASCCFPAGAAVTPSACGPGWVSSGSGALTLHSSVCLSSH